MTDQDDAPGKGFPVMVPECGRAIEPGPIVICDPCAPRGACLMAPVVIPPVDPERDARVAARRAADARRAGRALDRLLAPDGDILAAWHRHFGTKSDDNSE